MMSFHCGIAIPCEIVSADPDDIGNLSVNDKLDIEGDIGHLCKQPSV